MLLHHLPRTVTSSPVLSSCLLFYSFFSLLPFSLSSSLSLHLSPFSLLLSSLHTPTTEFLIQFTLIRFIHTHDVTSDQRRCELLEKNSEQQTCRTDHSEELQQQHEGWRHARLRRPAQVRDHHLQSECHPPLPSLSFLSLRMCPFYSITPAVATMALCVTAINALVVEYVISAWSQLLYHTLPHHISFFPISLYLTRS